MLIKLISYFIPYIRSYLYTGKVDITKCNGFEILSLLVASDELDLGILVEFTQSYLIKSCTAFINEQPAQVLRSVLRLESCRNLKDFCLEIICDEPENLFKSDNYLALEEDMFAILLQRDDLCINEVKLWKYVLKWGLNKHPTMVKDPTSWSADDIYRMEETLKTLIQNVRFFVMSSEEYYNDVRPYKKLLPKKLRGE